MNSIEIYQTGGNSSDHPFFQKNWDWAYHSHALVNGSFGCKISGKYICYDLSIEDQNGLPTCPKCLKKTIKAREQNASCQPNLISLENLQFKLGEGLMDKIFQKRRLLENDLHSKP